MDAILSLGVTQLVDLLTTEKMDLTVLGLDQRRDLLHAGRPLRRVDRRADRRPLGPAAPPLGLPAALGASRPPDRVWNNTARTRPDFLVPVAGQAQYSSVALGPDRSPAGFTGAGGWPVPNCLRATSAKGCGS